MDAPKIVALLTSLRCDHIRVKERWVEASCPMARWTHAKAGTDSRPSFGVAIEPGGLSRWRCHGCSRGGTLNELLWTLKQFDATPHTAHFSHVKFAEGTGTAGNVDVKTRMASLDAAKATEGPKGWYVPKRTPAEIAQALTPLPESDLTDYFLPLVAKSDAGRYLLGPKRRLGCAVWEAWGLCWHEPSNRVAIPIRDEHGRLMGITGRAVNPAVKKRWLHSTGFRRDYVVFGEDHFRPEHRTAYVVEGNFDTIYLWSRGYVGAAGVMGSYISPYQLQQFKKFFDKAVIFRDGDEPGKKAAVMWEAALRPWMPVTLADVQTGRDPDEYSREELRDILGPPPVAPVASTTLD